MERREAEAIYEQGRDAVVSVLVALSAQNERLEAQVERLNCESGSSGRADRDAGAPDRPVVEELVAAAER